MASTILCTARNLELTPGLYLFLGGGFPEKASGIRRSIPVVPGDLRRHISQDPKAIKIWHDFNESFPGWESGKKKDEFP